METQEDDLLNDEKEYAETEKRKNEIIGILIITLGILSLISIFTSTGLAGEVLIKSYKYLIGSGYYLIPILLIIWGIALIRLKTVKINIRLTGFFISYIFVFALVHTYLYSQFALDYALLGKGGGIVAGFISWGLIQVAGVTGVYIIILAFLIIGILLWTDIYLHTIFNKIFNRDNKKHKKINEEMDNMGLKEDDEYLNAYIDNGEVAVVEENKFEEESFETDLNEEAEINDEELKFDYNGKYQLPDINILKASKKKKYRLDNKSELLEKTLNSFGVEAKVNRVKHGPTITRYEVQPASGVKVSKIVNLADDIALSLASSDVRIEAPIPGKAAVGIEVPHNGKLAVRLRDVIISKEFEKSNSKLSLALGKGIDGEAVVADLTQMPHLLVAGATGSGKSVCINSLISSIIFKSTPDEVKFILIDPKKVELNHYNGLPHLFSPVVTDPKKSSSVLKLVVDEMEARYDLFSDSGTRGISSYNKYVDEENSLPYIVVIIDELSDLMMVAASEVEDNICRLAQMSRAAGIHLIIATQRPSVDVITGLIKANIPSRISFAVSSQTDSRTVLDMGGAEKLLGTGDMLFSPVGAKKPVRIQGTYIDNEEISHLVSYLKSQADPEYNVELDDIKKVEIKTNEEKDKLYQEAVTLVVKYRASISMLQRRLHIGHSRAARLIDIMEEESIVGPYAGSKPREVLISEDELETFLNQDVLEELDEEGLDD